MHTEQVGHTELVPKGSWRVVSERSHVGFKVKKFGLYFVKGGSAKSRARSRFRKIQRRRG